VRGVFYQCEIVGSSLYCLKRSKDKRKCLVPQQEHSVRTSPLDSSKSHPEVMEHPAPAKPFPF